MNDEILTPEGKALKYITDAFYEKNQEIKHLQQRVEYLERSNNRREDTILGLRQEIAEQEDYKTRNEKAVEYIENAQEQDADEESCSLHVPTLKSILESRSDK